MKTVKLKINELCLEIDKIYIPVTPEGEELDEETKKLLKKKYEIITKLGRLVYLDWRLNETISFEGERLMR
jgi:hypothetical protein